MRDQLEALILQMYKSNILYSEAVREFKKRFILTVLEENRGNQCKAARELGMHRNTLSRTMQELKIDVRPHAAHIRRPWTADRSGRSNSGGEQEKGGPARDRLSVSCLGEKAFYRAAGFLRAGAFLTGLGAAFTSNAPSFMVMTNGLGT